LLDQTLKITTDGREAVQTLPDSPAYLDALKEHFGIELEASYDDLKPRKRSQGTASALLPRT